MSDMYTDAQMLARAVCKLQVEMSELVRDVVLPVSVVGNVKGMMLSAGLAAQQALDMEVWRCAGPIDHVSTGQRLCHELSDCYAALAAAQQALARLFPDEPIDIQRPVPENAQAAVVPSGA